MFFNQIIKIHIIKHDYNIYHNKILLYFIIINLIIIIIFTYF